MVDSVLEVQNIKLPDSGGVTSSTAITLDASGNTTATLSSSSNIKAPLNATGSAPVYACRAWVNFNGTGTVAIRASGNVSSITDNGTGNYAVNFTTAMPDANYAAVSCGWDNGVAPNQGATVRTFPIAEYLSIRTQDESGTLYDNIIVQIAIFR